MTELTIAELAAEIRAGSRCILQLRHAERPKMDATDPTFGDALKLTDEGVRTSRKLGEMLAEFRDDVQFWSSPLTRTRMTAACVAEGMGLAAPEIPTDECLGNGTFYYVDTSLVLEVFQPARFFDSCFKYFREGDMPGFRNLREASDMLEAWLEARFTKRLFVATTHDCYIAAFLVAKGAVEEFTRENWPRFLDGGAILFRPDGTKDYALVRTGLSTGICGVGGKVM